METWINNRLRLNERTYLDIQPDGDAYNLCFTSHGESAPVGWGYPSVEDAKIQAATLLRQWADIALMCAFK